MEEFSGKMAKLEIADSSYKFPLVESTVGMNGINLSTLKNAAGYVSYDNGFANTASCISNITFVDGDNGILRYRGFDIADLVENCTFVEVAYLLIHGALPTAEELRLFSRYLNYHSLIHEDMHHFFNGFPADSHPMSILASMVTSLSSFYPYLTHDDPIFEITAARLISKVRTIAAFSYRKSRGEPVVYPRHDMSYCANFLNMMFSSPVNPYEIQPEMVNILNKLLILHADHGQNCSATAVRLVASARANLYASVSAGICALWGSLHGGANQAVIEMLTQINESGRDINRFIEKAKDKNDPFRLMGFGHAVYKNYDPRARICKQMCDELFSKLEIRDPLLDIALEMEEIALKDDYFVSRRLYPNVDFYTGILYRAMNIPTNMLTVMFVIGRLPGWIAQWREGVEDKGAKIYRPRQIYTGPRKQAFVPIDQREKLV
ncbi:MAG: citrate synthase [Chitinivibrionales bacterium]